MHSHVFVFLLALAVLFGAAKACGALATRLGCPPVVGEIFGGILVGKTVLGRLWPESFEWLFLDASTNSMLQGYKTIAVVLLLAVAGLELDTSTLRRSTKALAITCVFSAVIPFGLGYGTGQLLPNEYLADPSQRSFHALFLGIALAISALPVIARTLMDLGLSKSDIGLFVMSAALADDLIGWICFSVLVREMSGTGASAGGSGILVSIALTVGFLVVALVALRPVIDRWLRPGAGGEPVPTARALSMIMILALLGASATEGLGIHAVFGGFVVGIAIGRSPQLPEQTRDTLKDCVTTLFTPVFFAMMALRYDFVDSFDPGLVVVVILVATIAKVGGCTLGAWLGGIRGRSAWAIGFGLNSRGAMEILLASIALEASIINEQIFVALVMMAVTTSMISGPAMARLLRTPTVRDH